MTLFGTESLQCLIKFTDRKSSSKNIYCTCVRVRRLILRKRVKKIMLQITILVTESSEYQVSLYSASCTFTTSINVCVMSNNLPGIFPLPVLAISMYVLLMSVTINGICCLYCNIS